MKPAPDDDPHSRLRAQLRAGRELLSLTQGELAERLGLTLSKISRAENGETKSGDILLDIKARMERIGVGFTRFGVELMDTRFEVIEGDGCYARLLDAVAAALADADDKELLLMFASDRVSPPEVNARYRRMRKAGVTMRQLIAEGDSYIMGALEEYRTVPKRYFTNIVTVVFGDSVAQVNGDETRIFVHHDARLAKREREIFSYFWDTGGKPRSSTADQTFQA